LIGVLLALFLLLWQTLVFEAFAIALDPAGWHVGANPLRSYLREDIQHVDHGLSDTQDTVERTDAS
jgi:hypothetical protein